MTSLEYSEFVQVIQRKMKIHRDVGFIFTCSMNSINFINNSIRTGSPCYCEMNRIIVHLRNTTFQINSAIVKELSHWWIYLWPTEDTHRRSSFFQSQPKDNFREVLDKSANNRKNVSPINICCKTMKCPIFLKTKWISENPYQHNLRCNVTWSASASIYLSYGKKCLSNWEEILPHIFRDQISQNVIWFFHCSMRFMRNANLLKWFWSRTNPRKADLFKFIHLAARDCSFPPPYLKVASGLHQKPLTDNTERKTVSIT